MNDTINLAPPPPRHNQFRL